MWCFGILAGTQVLIIVGAIYAAISERRRSSENHAAGVALGYFAYNFIKAHRTLRMSPAMAAGVTNRLWEVADLVAAWESEERRRSEIAA